VGVATEKIYYLLEGQELALHGGITPAEAHVIEASDQRSSWC